MKFKLLVNIFFLFIISVYSLFSQQSSTNILDDKIVDIYVGGNMYDGCYQFSGKSVDVNGRSLFSFYIYITEYELTYDYSGFKKLHYTLELTDLRGAPNPNKTEKRIMELPPSEAVNRVAELGKTPKTPIVEKENLRISISFLNATPAPGYPSTVYKNLNTRVIVELVE